jgi:NDP-sugar pyrophosphorylase family protein
MQVVLLVGGLGTRISTLHPGIPKVMVPIGPEKRPFIDLVLSNLACQGVKNVLLCTGYLGNLVNDYVEGGQKWGLTVNYSADPSGQPLGTGGALRLAYGRQYLEPSFGLMYGDSFLPTSFKVIQEAFERQKAEALMTVFRNLKNWDQSNVDYRDGRIRLYEKQSSRKMHFIDYGLSILKANLISEYIPAAVFYDLASFFNALSRQNRLNGFEVHDPYYEVGSQAGIDRLNQFLS